VQIAHVSGRYPPHLGGQELVVAHLAKNQAAAGHQVTVFTSDSDLEPGTPGVEARGNLTILRLASRTVSHTPVVPGLAGALQQRDPSPEVIHLHAGHAGVAEQALWAARRLQVPLVVQMHLMVRPAGRLGTVLLPLYERLVLAKVLNSATIISCLTEAMRSQVIDHFGLLPDRVIVVPNGVEPTQAAPVEREPKTLLFVGRLTPQKGIMTLVEAMSLLPGHRLFVIGDGEQRPLVEAAIQRLGLESVFLLGRLPPAEILKWYRRASALVMPSTHEGMPLVMLEAMQEGLPVVASDIPELRETAGGAACLVPPNAGDIAASVLGLLSRPRWAEELARKGCLRASQHTWSAVARRFESVYAHLLDSVAA
jgi:glycosyltransferase involved in cell wall biosynthesis